MIDKYIRLLKHIQYEFSDINLLSLAFTHRSAAKLHNERLEFLGDAVLGLVIAQKVYDKYPQLPEGKLTRMRSNLVKGETLAHIARELDLGSLLLLGQGEKKSGGRRRDSILADAVEALIGAVYIDSNIDKTTKVIEVLFQERIDALDPNVQIKDCKTQLQELLQARQNSLPLYEVSEITGKDHAQTFTVLCSIKTLDLQSAGSGRSRRIAEQDAAKQMLKKMSS